MCWFSRPISEMALGTFSLLNGRCKVNNGRMKYMMTLANGVTVKNAILDTPGMGIYCEGNFILQNIYYKKLCYHAAGSALKLEEKARPSYTYQVIGGAGIGSPDKYFTQSGHGTTIINGFWHGYL
uniref:pectate lyase n=1 Tax=Globodera rostochiensis TaxID=31243 RepID=A0A914H3B1_GLORO